MPEHRKLGRDLRALWATLAATCFIGAGAAYAATRYTQGELEAGARRDAQKLTTEVLQPILTPRDVVDPIRGARYDELLAGIEGSFPRSRSGGSRRARDTDRRDPPRLHAAGLP